MDVLKEVTLLENSEVAPKTFLLKFRRDFTFKAGQVLGITINQQLPVRLYSICSGIEMDNISIIYTIKNDGALTPKLCDLAAGDKILITPPHGKFIMDNKPAWWIATGTGIAPFVSMFESNITPLKLIQGARTVKDLLFYEKWKSLNTYVGCCTQEETTYLYNGRLTQYLQNIEKLPEHINYYICGNTEMVIDVRNLLIGKGVSYQSIITEIYF